MVSVVLTVHDDRVDSRVILTRVSHPDAPLIQSLQQSLYGQGGAAFVVVVDIDNGRQIDLSALSDDGGRRRQAPVLWLDNSIPDAMGLLLDLASVRTV